MQDDEWRCHTMAIPPLREAQWRDNGSLAAAALGGGALGLGLGLGPGLGLGAA